MTRIKITWKWNGEIIREDSKDYIEKTNQSIDDQTVNLISKAGIRGSLAGATLRNSYFNNLPIPARAHPVGFIHYTNLLYQLLGGEVVHG